MSVPLISASYQYRSNCAHGEDAPSLGNRADLYNCSRTCTLLASAISSRKSHWGSGWVLLALNSSCCPLQCLKHELYESMYPEHKDEPITISPTMWRSSTRSSGS